MNTKGCELVLGLGESGLAMARWLTRQGARVRVADSRAQPPGAQQLREVCPGVELICGPFSERLLGGVGRISLSPGLSVQEPLVQQARARGIHVCGEIELFVSALEALGERQRCKLMAITGTNGKTTVTTLTGAMVDAAGRAAGVAGNISPAALDELMRRIDEHKLPDVWVLELSSFQLETTARLGADAAAVLNLSDDHLDRHGSMVGYAAAKAGVFAGGAIQVLNRQDAFSMGMALSGQKRISFGLDAPPGAEDFGLIEHGGERWLARGTQALMPAVDVPLAGEHNLANVLAALALCAAIGLPMPPLLGAVQAFRGLPHRVERVARRADGVVFYDDSKGTNVGATLAAIEGLGKKIVLIAGGDGKGQNFAPLTRAFRAHVRSVVLIGKDGRRLAQETQRSEISCVYAESMEDAVLKADALAQPGDAVLLSPACASMDMFRNYAHRAEVFIAAVRQLSGVLA